MNVLTRMVQRGPFESTTLPNMYTISLSQPQCLDIVLASSSVSRSNFRANSTHLLQPSENQVLCPSTNLHIAYMQAIVPIVSALPKICHSFIRTGSCPYHECVVWVEQQVRTRSLYQPHQPSCSNCVAFSDLAPVGCLQSIPYLPWPQPYRPQPTFCHCRSPS